VVQRIVGEGQCLRCGKPTRLRKGTTVKFCSIACGDRYRAQQPAGQARAERYNAARREARRAARNARAARQARFAEWGQRS